MANVRPSEILKSHIRDVEQLANTHHIAGLHIFGSVSRNADNENSDIDMLAIFESDATLFDYASFSRKLESLLGIECDVLTNEILAVDAFADLIEKSITLEEFANGCYTDKGAVRQEERDSASIDNIGFIIERIRKTIGNISYEEFCQNSILYDALAYEFQLLGNIVSNSDKDIVDKYCEKYQIDLSSCARLPEILLKTIYPRMVYQTAKSLAEKHIQ